jgi:hypothetical protein
VTCLQGCFSHPLDLPSGDYRLPGARLPELHSLLGHLALPGGRPYPAPLGPIHHQHSPRLVAYNALTQAGKQGKEGNPSFSSSLCPRQISGRSQGV